MPHLPAIARGVTGAVASAVLAACLGVVAGLLAGQGAAPMSGAAAAESPPCVSKSEYHLIADGLTVRQLTRLLDGQPSSTQSGRHHLLRYAACSSWQPGRVLVVEVDRTGRRVVIGTSLQRH